MEGRTLIRLGGAAGVAAGVMLPLWWIGLGAALPVSEAAEHWDLMLTHANWVPVNVLGLLGTIAWTASILGLFARSWQRSGKPGLVGFALAGTGALLYVSIQYYETFLWPVVAHHEPSLVQLDGPLVFGDPMVVVPLVVAGGLVGLGYLVWGFDLVRRGPFSRLPVGLLVAGAVVFANGVAFPVRTLGLFPFAAGMIWLGLWTMRNPVEQGEQP